MGNSNKKQNQATDEKKDETQVQPGDNPQTENPALTGDGNGDTQLPVTPHDDSDADSGSGNGGDNPPADETGGSDEKSEKDSKTKDKKVKLTLRHKSHTQHYYRCGLMLTKVFAEYEVSEEAVAKIKADKWIEIKGSK